MRSWSVRLEFNGKKISHVLNLDIDHGVTIYSGAYIMPSGPKRYSI